MRNILCILLAFPAIAGAQFPYVEILHATDTETLVPTFRAYVSANADYGVAIFQMGNDSMDLQDCALALLLFNSDTVLFTREVGAECDSFYFYQAFVANDFHSSASAMLSFSAPTCAGIQENDHHDFAISIIPNPVTLVSKVQAPPTTHIEIYDLLGRRKNVVTINGVVYLYQKDFTSGLYVCRASKNGTVVTEKFLVE